MTKSPFFGQKKRGRPGMGGPASFARSIETLTLVNLLRTHDYKAATVDYSFNFWYNDNWNNRTRYLWERAVDKEGIDSLFPFTYLLLHRQAPQARRHLAFLLWPDSSEPQALTNLRKALTQCLYTDPSTTTDPAQAEAEFRAVAIAKEKAY